MEMNCLVVIACLVAGFLLGRMGGRFYYDGIICFGGSRSDFQIQPYYSEEQLARRGSVLLRVVDEVEEKI